MDRRRKASREGFEELTENLEAPEIENVTRATWGIQSDVKKSEFDKHLEENVKSMKKTVAHYERETEQFQNVSGLEGRYNNEQKINLREARMAMLLAGMDLDTTLLVTPEYVSLEEDLHEADYFSENSAYEFDRVGDERFAFSDFPSDERLDTSSSLDGQSDYSEITFHICKKRRKVYGMNERQQTDDSSSAAILKTDWSESTKKSHNAFYTGQEQHLYESSGSTTLSQDRRASEDYQSLFYAESSISEQSEAFTAQRTKPIQVTDQEEYSSKKDILITRTETNADNVSLQKEVTTPSFASLAEMESLKTRVTHENQEYVGAVCSSKTEVAKEMQYSRQEMFNLNEEAQKNQEIRHSSVSSKPFQVEIVTQQASYSQEHTAEKDFRIKKSYLEGDIRFVERKQEVAAETKQHSDLEKKDITETEVFHGKLSEYLTDEQAETSRKLISDYKADVSIRNQNEEYEQAKRTTLSEVEKTTVSETGEVREFQPSVRFSKVEQQHVAFEDSEVKKQHSKYSSKDFSEGQGSAIQYQTEEDTKMKTAELRAEQESTKVEQVQKIAVQTRLDDEHRKDKDTVYETRKSSEYDLSAHQQISESVQDAVSRNVYNAFESTSDEIGAVTARRRFVDAYFQEKQTAKQIEGSTLTGTSSVVKGNLNLEKDRITELSNEITLKDSYAERAVLYTEVKEEKKVVVEEIEQHAFVEIFVAEKDWRSELEQKWCKRTDRETWTLQKELDTSVTVPVGKIQRTALTAAASEERSQTWETSFSKLLHTENCKYTRGIARRETLCFIITTTQYHAEFKLPEKTASMSGIATDSYCEKVMAKIKEVQSKECNLHFDRIHLRTPTEKASLVMKTPRSWKENFLCEAAKSLRRENTFDLARKTELVDVEYTSLIKVKETIKYNTHASKKVDMYYSVPLKKNEQETNANVVCVGWNHDRAEPRYLREPERMNAWDVFWVSVLNQLDTEVAHSRALTECARLETVEAKEVHGTYHEVIEKFSGRNESTTTLRESVKSQDQRQFEIAEGEVHALAGKAITGTGTGRVLIEKQLATTEGKFIEAATIQRESDLVFLKQRAKKTNEEAVHVVNLSTTLAQSFETLFAKTAVLFYDAELSVEYPEHNVHEIKPLKLKENISLNTAQATTAEMKKNVELQKSSELNEDVQDVFQQSAKHRVIRSLKESEDKAYELLADWRSVETDLLVEKKLYDVCFGKHMISVTESSEEHVALFQNMGTEEQFEEAECTVKVEVREACMLRLGIENDFLNIRMEKFPKSERTIKYLKTKRGISVCRNLGESVLNKINITVNIQRLPINNYNQHVNRSWNDRLSVSATPLRLRCEASELVAVYTEEDLYRQTDYNKTQITFTTSNIATPLLFECEQAGNERSNLLIDLHGGTGGTATAAYIWPDVRMEPSLSIHLAEFEEEEAWLLANVNTLATSFMAASSTVTIARNHEPLRLTTKQVVEEATTTEADWEVPTLREEIQQTVKVSNRGTNIVLRFEESQETNVTAGFYFSHEEQTLLTEAISKEIRNGGQYQLNTAAAEEVFKTMSISLLKRSEAEAGRQRMVQKQQAAISVNIAASTTQTIYLDKVLALTEKRFGAFLTKNAPRRTEPILVSMRETTSSTIITNAQYTKYTYGESYIGILKEANYGGHFTLETDYAEEIVFNVDCLFRADESFAVANKCLTSANVIEGRLLNTQASQLAECSTSTELLREEHTQKVAFTSKSANKGENVEVDVIETKQVQGTTYLNFSKKVSSAVASSIFALPNYGGKFVVELDESEENYVNVVYHMQPQKQLICSCEKTVASSNIEVPLQLITKASCTSNINVQLNLMHQADVYGALTTAKEKNITVVRYDAKESEIAEINIFFYFTEEPSSEVAEELFATPRIAGPLLANLSASTLEEVYGDYRLEKIYPKMLAVIRSFDSPNFGPSITMSTNQSTEIKTISDILLHRNLDEQEIFIIHRTGNKGQNTVWNICESKETEEIITCQYRKAGQEMTMQYTVNIPFYGGSILLHSEATKDTQAVCSYSLIPTQNRYANSSLVIKHSNQSEPFVFVTKASVLEELVLRHLMQRANAIASTSLVRKDIRKAEIQTNFIESTTVDKSTNIQFYKTADNFYDTFSVNVKRFGGSLTMSTRFASDEEINCILTLAAIRIEAGQGTLIFHIPNIGGSMLLHKEYAREEATLERINLSRLEMFGYAETEVKTSRQEKFIGEKITEVLLEEETTNAHYYQRSSGATINKILNQSNYGGTTSLYTNASSEKTTQHLMLFENENQQLYRSEVVLRTVNKGEPVELFAYGTTSECTATTFSLQKSSNIAHKHISLLTPRLGEKQDLRSFESQSVEFNNNTQFRKEIQDCLGVEKIFREGRYGGNAHLLTKYAAETTVFGEQHCTKSDRVGEALFTKEIPTTAEPLIVFCTATEESKLYINYNFSSHLESKIDAKLIYVIPNSEKALEYNVAETTEVDQTSNFSLQKTRQHQEFKTTLTEKTFGGRKEFSCEAATSVAQNFMITLNQRSAFAEQQCTRSDFRLEHAAIDCASSKVENQNGQWSLQKSTNRICATKIILSIPARGDSVTLSAMQTEESIFNMDVQLEKQTPQFTFIWTAVDKRTEIIPQLGTKASQITNVEITKVENRKRLIDLQTDLTIYRDTRTITPVFFITDYAKESLVRKDETMESRESRHQQQTFSKLTEVISESEQLVCAAPVKVEFRQTAEMNELKEEKTEKR